MKHFSDGPWGHHSHSDIINEQLIGKWIGKKWRSIAVALYDDTAEDEGNNKLIKNAPEIYEAMDECLCIILDNEDLLHDHGQSFTSNLHCAIEAAQKMIYEIEGTRRGW